MTSSSRSVASGSPTLTRTPSPCERPDQHPGRVEALRERRRVVAEREPDEVGLAVRDGPALRRAARPAAGRARRRARRPASAARRSRRSDARAASCADVRDAERGRRRADAPREPAGARPRSPTRRPARPNALENVRSSTTFGWSREHGEAVAAPAGRGRTRRRPRRARRARRSGTAARNVVELVGVHGRARRVVRRADQHDPGAVGDRRGHRRRGRAARRRPPAPCTPSAPASVPRSGTPRTTATATTTSSPALAHRRAARARSTATEPQPATTFSAATPERRGDRPRPARSRTCRGSG